jgi:hypothetical protein
MGMRGVLLLLLMSLSACTTTDLFTTNDAKSAHQQTEFSNYEHHYLFEPSPVQLAKGLSPTDNDILAFSENVKEALRRRMNRARLARMFSGTIQVLTAATGAGLGAVSANIETITALAGTSAVMPQLQELFGARERAQYYEQGASMIDQAQGRYFGAIARKEVPSATPPTISLAAVALFNETVAAITVVEKALVDRLPTVEELQKATGAYTDLKFAPEDISVDVGTEVEAIIGGTATVGSVVVGDPQKASATLSGRTVKIKGLAGGATKVIATDALGKPYLLAVTVIAPAAVSIDPVDPALAVGADLLVTVSAALSAGPEVEDTATATATLVNPQLLRIHGVKAGTTHMVIPDGNAQPYKFQVEVKAAPNPN